MSWESSFKITREAQRQELLSKSKEEAGTHLGSWPQQLHQGSMLGHPYFRGDEIEAE